MERPRRMTALEEEWESAWRWFDDALEAAVAPEKGWDKWDLAMGLDVPGHQISTIVARARAAGLAKGFDFEGKLRRAVRQTLARMRELGRSEADPPLHADWGLTGAILAWEWEEMVAAGDPRWMFFERLRELRLRLPEIALCEREVHRFCERVPPARFEDA
jgi:hypothetical protein